MLTSHFNESTRSLFSGKRGVGKTRLATATSISLANLGYRTCQIETKHRRSSFATGHMPACGRRCTTTEPRIGTVVSNFHVSEAGLVCTALRSITLLLYERNFRGPWALLL